MASITSADFQGENRLDIAISEQGASAVIKKMHTIAAACQKLDPGVAASLRGEALRLGEEMESVCRGAAVVALQTAVMSTPVDTGLARSGWACKVNKSRPQSHPTPEVDPVGLKTIEEGTFVINNAERQPGEIFWISNSQAHIVALEKGHSRQAPNGMTKLAVQAAETFVSRNRILKRGKL
jgi:hypothetical protein